MARWFDKWLLLLLPLMWVGITAHGHRNMAHPFYVSVTEINHNAGEKSLEISCKVFVDDMEAALKQQFKTVVDLTSTTQTERSNGFVSQYVQKHLLIKVNGRPVALHFVGFEKESESVYCYFEATGLPSVQKLEVNNSLLHDYTPEQINIMHVTVGGKRQSTKLNYPATAAVFNYQ